MSTDRRELILLRLIVVAQGMDWTPKVYRNRGAISAGQRPAIVILDSDEEGTVGDFALGRPLNTPNIVRMSPEICLIAGGPADVIGSALNAYRLAVIPAVLSDPGLSDLIGVTGGIQYQGCTTDLGRGRTMEGEMILNFEIHYVLKPAEMVS